MDSFHPYQLFKHSFRCLYSPLGCFIGLRVFRRTGSIIKTPFFCKHFELVRTVKYVPGIIVLRAIIMNFSGIPFQVVNRTCCITLTQQFNFKVFWVKISYYQVCVSTVIKKISTNYQGRPEMSCGLSVSFSCWFLKALQIPHDRNLSFTCELIPGQKT